MAKTSVRSEVGAVMILGGAPFCPFPVLYTARLRLRPVDDGDVRDLFALRSDAETARLVGRPRAESLADAREFMVRIKEGINRGEWIFWALSFYQARPLLGTVCLWNILWDEGRAELGLEVLSAYRRQGLMDEAVRAVLSHGYGPLALKTIDARVHRDNQPCQALLQKHGFRLEPNRGAEGAGPPGVTLYVHHGCDHPLLTSGGPRP